MESRELSLSGFDGCDESKCVSLGGWNHFSDDTTFTCYGDEGKFYPKMCADGFVPVTVEDEPTLSSADWYGFESANISVSYFTCCPPALEDPIATRRCSDPILSPSSEDATCVQAKDSTFLYPRPMKTNTISVGIWGPLLRFRELDPGVDSHLCCDYNHTGSVDYLDEAECVPYHDEDYNGISRDNQIGSAMTNIFPVTCDFPDNSFSIPRPSSTESRYQCCKAGTPMPPYVHDKTFNLNVYSSIVFLVISVTLSLIVVLSLLIPCIKSIKNLNSEDGVNSSGLSNGASSSRWSMRSRSSRYSRRSQSIRMGETGFSTYNVYLIFLAFLDLLWTMYAILVRVLYINQVFVPYLSTITMSISISYFFGNFWINALILYEIFILLKASKNAQRTKPPSFRRLMLQGGAIYTMVVVYALIVGLYFIPQSNMWVFAGINALVTFPAIIYVTALPFWIWKYDYLPPNTNIRASLMSRTSAGARALRDKAIRDMAIYFLRIVFIFVFFYMPLSLFVFLTRPYRSWPEYINEFLLGTQPTVTFVFLLTKPDVKKYILDLVTLKVFVGDKKPENTGGSTDDATNRVSGPAATPPKDKTRLNSEGTGKTQSQQSSVLLSTASLTKEKSDDMFDPGASVEIVFEPDSSEEVEDSENGNISIDLRDMGYDIIDLEDPKCPQEEQLTESETGEVVRMDASAAINSKRRTSTSAVISANRHSNNHRSFASVEFSNRHRSAEFSNNPRNNASTERNDKRRESRCSLLLLSSPSHFNPEEFDDSENAGSDSNDPLPQPNN